MRSVPLFALVACGEETVHLPWPEVAGARSAIVGYEERGAHLFAADLDGAIELAIELPDDRDDVPLAMKLYDRNLTDYDLDAGPLELAAEGVPSRSLPASELRFASTIGIDRKAVAWATTDATPILDAARIPRAPGPACFELGQTDITRDLARLSPPSFAVPVSDGLILGDPLGGLHHLTAAGIEPAAAQPAPFRAGAVGAEGRGYFAASNELWRGRATAEGIIDAVRVSTASEEIGHIALGSTTYAAGVFGALYAVDGDRMIEVDRAGDEVRELEVLPSGRAVALTFGRRMFELDRSGILRELSIEEAADFPQTLYVDALGRLLVGTTEGSVLEHVDPGFRGLFPEPFAFTILDVTDFEGSLVYAIASGFFGQLVGTELCDIFQVTNVLEALRLHPSGRSIYVFALRDDLTTRLAYRLDGLELP
jgi:hypothetical protein